MKQDVQRVNKKKKSNSVGPGDACNCPVCIFAKSQAPGDPYDLKDCPKHNALKRAQGSKKEIK